MKMTAMSLGLFILILSFDISPTSATAAWTYSDPEGWCQVAPLCCEGFRQSPIDLNPYASHADTIEFPKLRFSKGYGEYIFGKMENDGHSIKISPDFSEQRESVTVAGGPLPTDSLFEFAQFHFHWGAEEGSEHKVYGKRFPGELHLVHWNRNYSNLTEAVLHSDGLAVLGFFLEPLADGLSRKMTALESTDEALEMLIDDFENNPSDPQQGPYVPVRVNLTSFIDEVEHPEDYLTYKGSLTTPPCAEAVTWLVWHQPIRMSQDMLSNLATKLTTSEADPLVDNFRPTQPLNGRRVVVNEGP